MNAASATLPDLLRQMSRLSLADLQVVALMCEQQIELLKLRENHELTDDLEEMQTLRSHLHKRGRMLAAMDATLLACRYVQLSGCNEFNARQVNTVLMECDCKPSNTSTALDSLRQRQLIEVTGGDELGKHKTYRLTDSGLEYVGKIFDFKVIPYRISE